MTQSYYDILGVSPNASPEEVLAARQRRARLVDPHRVRHQNPENQAVAAELLRRLDTAFTVLEDEATRRNYDRSLAEGVSFAPPRDGSETDSERQVRELIEGEFRDAVTRISQRIEQYIRSLDPEIVWAKEVPDRGSPWNLVLAGQRQKARFRVYLEVLAELHPNHMVQRLMDQDSAILTMPPSPGEDFLAMLFLGGQLADSGRLYTTAEAFNQGAWNNRRPGRPRTYVAYANLDGGFPTIPGVADPNPDLAQLTIASAEAVPEEIPLPEEEALHPEQEEFEVLVVDDERLPFEIAKRYLKGEPYLLDHAVDWIEFKKLIHAKKYAALLLDIQLPTLSGDKLALYVNSNPDITPKPRIVLFSSLEEEELRRLSAKVGAHAFLRKGCGAEAMRTTMRGAARAYARDCIMMGPW